MIKIESKNVRGGQRAAYQDSVYVYEVNTPKDSTDAEVWEACQALRSVRHRNNAAHNGRCGFPFGLESFGTLVQRDSENWVYRVTHPYCD